MVDQDAASPFAGLCVARVHVSDVQVLMPPLARSAPQPNRSWRWPPLRSPSRAGASRAGVRLCVFALLAVWLAIEPLPGAAWRQPASVQASLSAPQSRPGEQVTAPAQTLSENSIDGTPIVLDGMPILSIRRGVSGFTAEERAETINRRLKRLAKDDSIAVEELTVRDNPDDNSLYVGIGQEVLLTVTERDAIASRMPKRQLANQSLRQIQSALIQYRQDRKPGQLLRNTLYALLAGMICLAVIVLLTKLSGRMLPWLARMITAHVPGIRFQNVEIISSAAISSFWLQALRFVRLLLVILILVYFASVVLRLYPWTRAVGEGIRGHFSDSLELLLTATANYLPNLFIVAIIFVVAFYALRVVKPFFVALERGHLVIPGFYQDWAKPTYNILVVLVIALSLILAFPYLPGFNSPAFQGISVFLGLLLSLGSTSAITNVIGGIILIYTRAFRVGDHIQVGDVIGDIIEKNFLAIRICTPTNQIITIPNSSLLINNVINFNISARELSRCLILQTTITLGYDVPWRKVHGLLVEAALATEHVLAEPAPFVLQTSLDNNYISYQLNAYTSQPNLMVLTYSSLHQNIQDLCNAQGVEILSPSYTALRDGRASTIPPREPQADG